VLNMKILVFACNWDGWSCIDAAANSDLVCPACVNLVKLTCLSSMNAGLILRSFEHGADGIMILGCEQRQCQYGTYNEIIEGELAKARELLDLSGLDYSRIKFIRLNAFDGLGYVNCLNDFISHLTSTGEAARELSNSG
jgi:coenzyme F420-reducing hydrogenase delta subunit